ncbi:MAG: hypothetical protein AAGI38_03075 [Bacteroidota bacterium]
MNKSLMCFLAVAILCAGCVQFKNIELYDLEASEPKPPRPEKLSKLVETDIFRDDTLTTWGIHNEPGKIASLSSEVKKAGENGIAIEWNRYTNGGEWVGFGMGWDNWAGKDLSGVYDYAAIRFYVKAKNEPMYALPMVMSLEDYSGKSSYAYTAHRYFERYSIDDEWQSVTVPLKAFDLDEFGMDISNVKQLQCELQQAGAVYLDEFQLIMYEEKPMESWVEVEELPSPVELPKVLFDDAFINGNGFGLMNYACQNIRISETEANSGGKAIHAEWDESKANCRPVEFGINWNKWRPFDMTSILKDAAIEFYIKVPGDKDGELPVSVGLRDYGFKMSGGYKTSSVKIQRKYVEGNTYTGGWQKVVIPVADFDDPWDADNARSLVFQFSGKGEILIDDLRLINNTKR